MKIEFSPQNKPIYPELRIMYRIVQILLVLSISSRGKKSSMIRLHLFCWGLSCQENRTALLKFSRDSNQGISFWSVDPMLNRAIEFAVADKLIRRGNGIYSITETGEEYIKSIRNIEEFESDISLLEMIGKNVTESLVSKQLDFWR